MKIAFVFVAFLLSSGYVMADQPTYPQASLLVEPAEFAKPEVAKQFIILDARERAKYDQSHIPNAIWVDLATWSKAFGDGDDAKGWSQRIAELGIDGKSTVVVYDDSLSKDAARIWWILRYWSLGDVRLLNGGWRRWAKNSMPVQKESPPTPTPSKFVSVPISKRLATKQSVLESLTNPGLQIVDARSEGEFCGTEKMSNKQAGAIPGAKHLEWSDLLDKETQQFKPAEQMRKLFDDAGIVLDHPTATHCQSGGRASVMAFGLELMGVKDVSNYYKSWGEWGNADDTPVVPGKPKK
jgi:thiosulfate/3-mercaptopyruvate sulfurtransferase